MTQLAWTDELRAVYECWRLELPIEPADKLALMDAMDSITRTQAQKDMIDSWSVLLGGTHG